jgi:hypothetical protein
MRCLSFASICLRLHFLSFLIIQLVVLEITRDIDRIYVIVKRRLNRDIIELDIIISLEEIKFSSLDRLIAQNLFELEHWNKWQLRIFFLFMSTIYLWLKRRIEYTSCSSLIDLNQNCIWCCSRLCFISNAILKCLFVIIDCRSSL